MAVISNEFFQQFVNAGIVPENVKRMVIDIEANEVVKVYYDCYGDKKMLELDLPASLQEAVKIRAKDILEGV